MTFILARYSPPITAPIIRVFSLFLILIISFQRPVLAETDLSHLSQDPQIVQARSLVEAGRHREALALLRAISPTPETKIDLFFLIGLAGIGAAGKVENKEEKAALLNEAITALHEILVARPALMRVRLELARAFFLKGEDELSQRQFAIVLAGQPPPAVVANINRFLKIMRGRQHWSGYFRFSYLPKENADYDQDQDLVYLNVFGTRLPFRFDDSNDENPRNGVAVSGGGEYEYLVNEALKFRVGVNLRRNEYPGGDSDSTFLGAYVGPRFLIDDNTDLSLLLDLGKHWEADESPSRDFGLRVQGKHRLSRRLTANASASHAYRLYHKEDDSENGPSSSVALSFSYLFRPTLQGNLSGGFSRARPKDVDSRSHSRWISAGAATALPFGFTVNGSAELRTIAYEGASGISHAGFTTSRNDHRRTLRLGVFNRGLTVQGFSPQLSLIHEDNESNAQRGGYKSLGWNLQFVRQF